MSTKRIVLLLGALMTGLGGAAWGAEQWLGHVLYERSWEGFVARQERLTAKYAADTGERESLVRPALDGNAWDDYALMLYEHHWRDNGAAKRQSKHNLECLRRGSRRRQAHATGDVPRVGTWPAKSIAEHAVGIGDFSVAIDHVAILLQATLDETHAQTGHEGPLNELLDVTHFIQETLLAQPLESSHLARIQTLLSDGERQFPSVADSMERMGHRLGEQYRERLRRNPLSENESAIAEFSALWANAVEALRDGENMKWSRAEKLLRTYRAEALSSKNRYVIHAGHWVWWWSQDWRNALAHWRLVRAAALVRSGVGPESADWPSDPFTLRPIKHARNDSYTIVACAEEEEIGWQGKTDCCDELRLRIPR